MEDLALRCEINLVLFFMHFAYCAFAYPDTFVILLARLQYRRDISKVRERKDVVNDLELVHQVDLDEIYFSNSYCGTSNSNFF